MAALKTNCYCGNLKTLDCEFALTLKCTRFEEGLTPEESNPSFPLKEFVTAEPDIKTLKSSGVLSSLKVPIPTSSKTYFVIYSQLNS